MKDNEGMLSDCFEEKGQQWQNQFKTIPTAMALKKRSQKIR